MRAAVLLFGFMVLFAPTSYAQQCLHGSNESAEQASRRRDALTAARFVNTLQANQPGAPQRRYLRHEDLAAAASDPPPSITLAPGMPIVAGWRLRLDVTPSGYWFAVTDTTDLCGFRYISNQDGLIFTAEPIR